MTNHAFEQEMIDAFTAMELAREAAKSNNTALLSSSLKDLRKRVNRMLKALDGSIRPQRNSTLPQEPRLPIRQ